MAEQLLLSMKNICKSFPGVNALQSVNFELQAGEVHALLGENGAGKSTLIKVLGGIYIPEQGEIYINGEKAEIHDVKSAQMNGVSIIHQELVLVPHMTVAENIFLGREPRRRGGFADRKKMSVEAQKLLDSYGMDINANTLVGRLTIAQQQMVEIIKAISYQSKILVMDEPTSSISDNEVTYLFEMIHTLVQKKVGIIYISHKMSELSQICDRVTVMRDGQTIGTKVVRQTTDEELISMMVGRELTHYYTRDYQPQDEIVLKCEKISDGKMVRDVNFELHKGEILGFAGLVGAGRSETMQCLFGLTKGATGNVYLNGQQVHIKSPTEAMKYGIAFVPEDRKAEGLYKMQSVRYNTTIEVLRQFIGFFSVNAKKERSITQEYIDKMDTRTPSQEQVIGNLSGGNQQKVLIGRWLATKPKVLILDEPTRGIDVGAKSEIYAIMNQLVKEGVSIIMISSELPEIINMSDRVYVMSDGVVRGCFGHEEVTQEKIMTLAAV